ncbi:hypothetical protein [Polynucleobacter sp. AM-7D1]|uniref:hypothetical protein n=1 Tax=Polynucleobacter sp. AM-7D1 TaxID=2689102 RepID=UPI001BFCF62E|nr:hypothetical protein [Polynucleobacter sp. AM-7D1]QWE29527.1 hypothetical protein GQ359_04495 [Polynucleobacter sp. AM-7D1]
MGAILVNTGILGGFAAMASPASCQTCVYSDFQVNNPPSRVSYGVCGQRKNEWEAFPLSYPPEMKALIKESERT